MTQPVPRPPATRIAGSKTDSGTLGDFLLFLRYLRCWQPWLAAKFSTESVTSRANFGRNRSPTNGNGRGAIIPRALEYLLLFVAAIPFIYYLIAIYSALKFFRNAPKPPSPQSAFTPPISNLKPVRGLDPEAYENFASFCRQDYPEFELLFCVHDESDPSVKVLEQLQRDFPDRRIRILYGSGRNAINDKVAKLVRLVSEAEHEVLVINDSDVRVKPDYFRTVVAPLQDSKVGGVTCLYSSVDDTTMLQSFQSIGMISDFFPGVMVAWLLDGVKFAFGQTIVTTRKLIAGFGGFQALESRPADDLLTGRLIAEQGVRVEMLPYAVQTVADYTSFQGLMTKRLRWMTVMRHMRPWGHLGLIFTQGIAWCLLAVAIHPTLPVAAAYLGTYLFLRLITIALVGAWGLHERDLWKKIPLFVFWDLTAFFIWMASFVRRKIRWRGVDYFVRSGMLTPGGESTQDRKGSVAHERTT
jgi:ceramide glucosyltransferase